MSGQKELSYEVYYLQSGQWRIHARFAANKREEAEEEAKRLDTSGFEASCVVRESFDPETATSNETVVYHTPTLKTRPPVSSITSSAGKGGDGWESGELPPEGSAAANALIDARARESEFQQQQAEEAAERAREEAEAKAEKELDFSRRRAAKQAEKKSAAEVIYKFIVVSFVSVPVAALGALGVILGLDQLAGFGVSPGAQLAQLMVIASFIATYVLTFLFLLRKYVLVGRAKPGPAVDGMVQQPQRIKKSTGETDMQPPLVDLDFSDILGDDAKLVTELDPPVDLEVAHLEADATQLAELEAQEAAKRPKFEGLTPEEAEVADELTQLPAHANEDSDPKSMSDELERIEIEAWRIVGKNTDDYTRFGLTLFMAGAGEALARKYKIGSEEALSILIDYVVRLGNTENLARGFLQNIEEYLLETRYFTIYNQGRAAAYRRITSDDAQIGLDNALVEWRAPAPQASEQIDTSAENFVAILFTDIVDSTAQQQANGDDWMMEIIRAHNELVRNAVRNHHGREIKHMGDGILATFKRPNDAIDAAVAMQQDFKTFSETMPKRAFAVRIGVHAGEAIHEGGDVFGTPVNLSARILSKANAGQIYTSASVVEYCEPLGTDFDLVGDFELKGFKSAQTLYKVRMPIPA